MSLSSRMIAVLTSVGILSGAFLASVGMLTKERIAYNKQMEIERAILSVVPGTNTSQQLYKEKDFTIYGGLDESGGYAIYASGIGFQDKIDFMFGINVSISKINSLTIIKQLETPGLGSKITERDSFLIFWENKDCSNLLALRKPAATSPEELSPSEVNTITGATISSEAVLNIVNESLEKIRLLETEGKLTTKEKNAR